jgi:hypothetical protein
MQLNNKMFDAFSNRFTQGQLKDIIHMSRMAKKAGIDLHEALEMYPPKLEHKNISPDKKRSFYHLTCPHCGRKLSMSQIDRSSEKYREGYKTYILCGAACCSNKGCGYEEFSKKTIKELTIQGG